MADISAAHNNNNNNTNTGVPVGGVADNRPNVRDVIREGLLLVDAADGLFLRHMGEAVNQTLNLTSSAAAQASASFVSSGGSSSGSNINAYQSNPTLNMGPVTSDIGALYDCYFSHRKQLVSEVNLFLRIFERREAMSGHALLTANRATTESLKLVDPCVELMTERLPLVIEHLQRVNVALKKGVGRETDWQTDRDQKVAVKKAQLEQEKTEYIKDCNRRMNEIDEWTKQQQEALHKKYYFPQPQPQQQPQQPQQQQQ